jgi:hypothetical protein
MSQDQVGKELGVSFQQAQKYEKGRQQRTASVRGAEVLNGVALSTLPPLATSPFSSCNFGAGAIRFFKTGHSSMGELNAFKRTERRSSSRVAR